MPAPTASIFAVELDAVLRAHGKSIDDLARQPFSLERRKVERLTASLRDVSQLPALNHGELMSVVLLLKLSEAEQFGLFAALVGLGAQRLMLEYLPPARAYAIAQEVRDAAARRPAADETGFFRRRTLRDAARQVQDWEAGEQTLFDEAWNAYDEGIALTAIGSDRGGPYGVACFARAVLALERAEALMRLLPESVWDDDDWSYWHAEIERELAEARAALE